MVRALTIPRYARTQPAPAAGGRDAGLGLIGWLTGDCDTHGNAYYDEKAGRAGNRADLGAQVQKVIVAHQAGRLPASATARVWISLTGRARDLGKGCKRRRTNRLRDGLKRVIEKMGARVDRQNENRTWNLQLPVSALDDVADLQYVSGIYPQTRGGKKRAVIDPTTIRSDAPDSPSEAGRGDDTGTGERPPMSHPSERWRLTQNNDLIVAGAGAAGLVLITLAAT